jgi:2-oxo-3-hexenedioate decarboxylase
MNEDAEDRLARELIALHDAPRTVAPFSERYAQLSAEAGYRAARRLHAHRVGRGWKPVGRKIGFTNRTLWPRYGVFEPMWGTVYDRTLIEARAGHAQVELADLVQPRIEPEICFGLERAPQPGGDPQALLGALSWVAHAIEIVQCHHPGWKMRIADCSADNGLHGRLILGERLPIASLPGLAEALPAAAVTLARAGQPVDRGTGANVLGSPLHALAFLIEVLARQPEAPPLAAGELVTTGVLTDAHPVAPGETWSTSFTGLALPGLTVTFS